MSERSGYRNGRLIYPVSVSDHSASAGGGGTIPANSVGTEEIKDNSIRLEDLNEEVREKIEPVYDAGNERLILR